MAEEGLKPFENNVNKRVEQRVARRDEHGYVFDVRLQGEDETVFLVFPGA